MRQDAPATDPVGAAATRDRKALWPAGLKSVVESRSAELRAQRLMRAQAVATGLLAAMAATYVSSFLIAKTPWIGFIRAFSEAAVIGGCADWFAVTALFRRPFGLPIPHTAIIPSAKDRIGDALGRFIVENFLGPKTLDSKLRELKLAAWGGAWLRRPETARAVADRALKLGAELSRSLPRGALEEVVDGLAVAVAKAVPAAPTAAVILEALWSDVRFQLVVTRLTMLAEDYLRRNQTIILEQVQGRSWRWLPAFVDRAIAAKITSGLIQLLSDVQNPFHPWRVGVGAAAKLWISRLASDPGLREEGEVLKKQVLNNPKIRQHASRLWSDVELQIKAGFDTDAHEHVERLARILAALGSWLTEDLALQRSLNTSARAFVRRVLSPRRHEIGRYVAQIVQGWDASTMVSRLELQVGSELQFIRVNGTIVGGAIGLIFYTCSRLVGFAEG